MIDKLKKITNNTFELISNEKSQKSLKNINLLLSFFCLLFVTNIFIDYRNEQNFTFKVYFDEIAIIFISYLISSSIWANFMKSNYGGSFSNYFYNWSFSKLGKYIPSGIMTVSVRVNQELPKKQNSKKIFYGLFEEQFIYPLIAIPALFISLNLSSNENKLYIFLITLAISFILFRYIYFKIKPEYISMLDQKFLFLLNLLIQLVLFYQIAINLNYDEPFTVALYYYLSTSIGLFFIGVPGGIGIRELIFLTLTNNFLGNIELINFILKTRLLFIIFDLIFGLIGLIKTTLLNRKTL